MLGLFMSTKIRKIWKILSLIMESMAVNFGYLIVLQEPWSGSLGEKQCRRLPVFDGITRHTQEGYAFQQRAAGAGRYASATSRLVTLGCRHSEDNVVG